MLHEVFSPQRNFPSHKMLLQSGPKKDVQIRELDSAPAVENFRPKKKTFFVGEANAPSTMKVASLALPKANLVGNEESIILNPMRDLHTMCATKTTDKFSLSFVYFFLLPDGCGNMSLYLSR